MLRVERLTAGYGQLVVLREVSFTVPTGAILTVAGPNGAGKTTLLRTLAGIQPALAGQVHHLGRPLHLLPAHRVARLGVALVPQGRRVFASLTVDEHLRLALSRAGAADRTPWRIDRLWAALPALLPLRNRRAGLLSGGEQQLLAVARALATNPSLLLLDEPAEGLSPALGTSVDTLIRTVAAEGVTVLVTAADASTVQGDALTIHKGGLR